MAKICIGLFGTCGGSTWRQDIFIPAYEERGWRGCTSAKPWDGEQFFDPQLPGTMWDDILAAGGNPAVLEAEHLASDAVVCFPVTGETFACGSLAETGYSILNAIKLNDQRDFIVMVDGSVDKSLLEENPVAAKESNRSRALVREHLKRQMLSNLYYVDTLQQMLDVSIQLLEVAMRVQPLRKQFNIPCVFP